MTMTHPLAAEAAQALEGVTLLIKWANARTAERYVDGRPHFSLADADKVSQLAAALTALIAEAVALKAQVAELTRERDRALAERDVLAAFSDAAEAKVAELTP